MQRRVQLYFAQLPESKWMPRPEWGLPQDTVQLRRRRDHFPKNAQREWSENILHICNAQVNKTLVSDGVQWWDRKPNVSSFKLGFLSTSLIFSLHVGSESRAWFAGQEKDMRRRQNLLQLVSMKLRGYRFWVGTIVLQCLVHALESHRFWGGPHLSFYTLHSFHHQGSHTNFINKESKCCESNFIDCSFRRFHVV